MVPKDTDIKNFSDMEYFLYKQRTQGKTIIDVNGVTELGAEDRNFIEGKINQYIANLSKETMESIHKTEVKEKIRLDIHAIANAEKVRFNEILHPYITQIANAKIDGFLGYGAIQDLINNPEITEIMVNGPGRGKIFYEKSGRQYKATQYFESEKQIKNVINAIVAPLNKRVDESSPIVDARLPDGSRVNAVISPIALGQCYLTIRKFRKNLTLEELIKIGTLTEKTSEFLRACILACLNIFILGGTGSGKTTILNTLAGFIPKHERIITIEDTAELKLPGDHVLSLETRPPNMEGKGEITMRDLIKTTLRMNPTRIIVGEVRGAEAYDMLMAMNTGHDGSLVTGHASSPQDGITRLEDMCYLAGLDGEAARRRINSAIDVIVEVQKMRKTGKRVIKSISAVESIKSATVPVKPIFEYSSETGTLEYTNYKPKFVARLEEIGYPWDWV